MAWMFRYSVSFEYPERPSDTHRGYVKAGSTAAGVRRAAEAAEKALRPRNWTSMVVCVLERAPVEHAAPVVKDNA
jgi:hypothetical protein